METSEKGKQTFDKILILHRSIESDMVKLGKRAENARKLLMRLYQSPVTSIKEVEDSLMIGYNPANELVNSLVKMNILEETTGFSRNRVFIFRRYVDTFGEQE